MLPGGGDAWSSTKGGKHVEPLQTFYYSNASETLYPNRTSHMDHMLVICGSTLTKIYLTTTLQAAALQGERLGDNEEVFAGERSRLLDLSCYFTQ